MMKIAWGMLGYGYLQTMATNNPWSVYMRKFPGIEEVKWTEKTMSKIYVVPKLSI